MSQAWIVRAGRNDEFERVAINENLIAIGWRRVGDLTPYTTKAEVRRAVAKSYPEAQASTRDTYAPQLFAFRNSMSVGDYVILLRANAPEVAVGEILSEYTYRAEPAPHHIRAVSWLRPEMRLGEIGPDLVTAPALTAVYRITKPGAVTRIREAVSGDSPPALPVASLPVVEESAKPSDNLRRNLNYARNLATAGSHLEKLGVTGFEVKDVYRAAWVQAVAALDHWVRQEIHERMLILADQPHKPRPDRYNRFELSLKAVEDVQAKRHTLREVLDEQLRQSLGFTTYQNPDRIKEGFASVAEVGDLWRRVAVVLQERSGEQASLSGVDVKNRIKEVVFRRNQIAHEYDEDAKRAPEKRHIDAASTMRTIDWIDQVAEAILIVLDHG